MYKYLFFNLLISLTTIGMSWDAHAMDEVIEEEHRRIPNTPNFYRTSKIASIYVDTLVNFDLNSSPAILQKIFSNSYTEDELKEREDIKYTVFNCLPSFTINYLSSLHVPFLNNFLKREEILSIEDRNIKKSLMLMSHDIRVAQAVKTLDERDPILEKIKYSIGKLYLVMFKESEQVREVIGSGTGTFVENENKKAFILSCAHFPSHMDQYDERYSFEMFFFPHFLLNEKTHPQGTIGAKIPFQDYYNLKINNIVFSEGTQVTLNKITSENNILNSDDIPNIRSVKEGRKDFACFLNEQIAEMSPMHFDSFSTYREHDVFCSWLSFLGFK